jgi:hypothetical protein
MNNDNIKDLEKLCTKKPKGKGQRAKRSKIPSKKYKNSPIKRASSSSSSLSSSDDEEKGSGIQIKKIFKPKFHKQIQTIN